MLNPQIDRELHRLLLTVGSEAERMQIGEPVFVEPFLDAGNALVVDIHMPNHMRHRAGIRIDALVLGEEADAGKAEPMNLLLLILGDFAL